MLQFVCKNLSVKSRIIYKTANWFALQTNWLVSIWYFLRDNNSLVSCFCEKKTNRILLPFYIWFFFGCCFLKTLFAKMKHFTNCQIIYNNNDSLETERILIARKTYWPELILKPCYTHKRVYIRQGLTCVDFPSWRDSYTIYHLIKLRYD